MNKFLAAIMVLTLNIGTQFLFNYSEAVVGDFETGPVCGKQGTVHSCEDKKGNPVTTCVHDGKTYQCTSDAGATGECHCRIEFGPTSAESTTTGDYELAPSGPSGAPLPSP